MRLCSIASKCVADLIRLQTYPNVPNNTLQCVYVPKCSILDIMEITVALWYKMCTLYAD